SIYCSSPGRLFLGHPSIRSEHYRSSGQHRSQDRTIVLGRRFMDKHTNRRNLRRPQPCQWGTLIESNSFQIVPILHDVAVVALHVTDGVIRVGTRVQVNVTVHNFGDEPETTSLMLYANNTTVGAQVVTNLPPETVREIPFACYAGGSGSGLYVLKAVANQVQGETDLSDNSQTI